MATIALTIPDAALSRVVDALCDRGGWTDADGPRPAFAKRVLAAWLKEETRSYEADKARIAALASAEAGVTVVEIT